MTIFKKDPCSWILVCVLLRLYFFQLLPYVDCQQVESAQRNANTKFTAQTVIGIILIAVFLLSMVASCFFYASHSAETEAGGHDVLNNRSRHGLDKGIIESFPFFLYSEVKGIKIGDGGVECAICLIEFEDEDALRLMPPCSHTFHAKCIDVWLSSESTCPVCRANLFLKPGESFPQPSKDLETGNGQRGILGSPGDISLIRYSSSSNNNANYTIPRSRSTGLLSSWRLAEIFIPRSHSTGHSSVRLGQNLDRFTLQLPEEVQRQLVGLRRSHMALPQARSLRQGYRSGSVGSSSSQRRQTLRRAISMSFSFSFQTASARSTLGRDDLVQETSQNKDKDSGEGSFERLTPQKV